MTDEPYLLVSLDEEKSKKLAQVLSNDTARKILDLMSKREFVTETEVSKDLDIPLSTAHYNLDLLLKCNLINDEQFKYSEKGKKIVHYALSNKYVIIAPKKNMMLDRLKELLPVVAICGLTGAGINFYMNRPQPAAMESAGLMMAKSADFAAEATAVALPAQPFALWFIAGCVFSIVTYLLVMTLMRKK
jgi:DNA-binding transcriptional ArsR family regulator